MPAVKIELQVGGVSEVRSTFRTVSQEIIRAQAQVNSARKRGTKETVEGAKDEATKVTAIQRAAANDAVKEAKRLAAEKARAEKLATRAVEQASRDVARIKKAEEREREAENNRIVRDAERSEKEITRIREREAQRRMREMANEDRARTAASHALRSDALGRVGGSIRSVVAGAGALAAGAMSFAGGLTATDAVRGRMAEHDAALAVSNAAFMPEVKDEHGKVIQERRDRPDARKIESRAREVSLQTGIDSKDLLAGLQSYIEKSSDYEGGMKNLGGLAALAKGTHAEMGDVMDAAGMLRSQNAHMSPEQMMGIMRNAIGQGQFGSVSLADVAKHASTVTAGASVFAGDQTANQGKLLGLMQVAGRAADPAEAATAVARFGDDIMKHRDELNSSGVHVSGKDGKLFDPATILKGFFEKTHGDVGKMEAMGLGERSIKLAKALTGTYEDAEKQQKGSGGEAVYKDVARIENAGYSQKDVDDSLSQVMSSDSEKMHAAMMKVEAGLATALMPAVDKVVAKLPEIVPEIERTIDAFVELVSFLLDHPLQAAFIGLAGILAKDVMAAGIGQAMQKAVEKSAAGNFAAGITIAAATISIIKAGIEEIDKTMDDKEKNASDVATSSGNDVSLVAKLSRGQGTASDKEAAQNEIERLTKLKAELEKGPTITEQALGAVASVVPGKSGENAVRDMESQRLDQMRALSETLDALKLAVEKNTTAHANNEGGGSAHGPDREHPQAGGARGGHS